MSRPSKNGGMRGSGEKGDPADVVVVVGQRAQPRVLVLHNLANTTCQRNKTEEEEEEEDRQYCTMRLEPHSIASPSSSCSDKCSM